VHALAIPAVPGHGARAADGDLRDLQRSLVWWPPQRSCADRPAASLQNIPESRAALSLLGYSYYYTGQFDSAAQMWVLPREHVQASCRKPGLSLPAAQSKTGIWLPCRYDQLVTLYPTNEDYKLYLAQALYKVRMQPLHHCTHRPAAHVCGGAAAGEIVLRAVLRRLERTWRPPRQR
jgi:hypothetical protein